MAAKMNTRQKEVPINNGYNQSAVIDAVSTSLTVFYDKLLEKINTVTMAQLLSAKNPYMYKAKGIGSVKDAVTSILSAYISSSEETLFGKDFFEPIAKAVSGGQKSDASGIDITIEKDSVIYSVAVKSGTVTYNNQSSQMQTKDFSSAGARVRQARKVFISVIGCAYGKKWRTRSNGETIKLAGKDFWEWLSGDADFYKKIMVFMGDRPEAFAPVFEEAYTRAENRLLKEFSDNFTRDDGTIDWEKILEFNSGD